MPRRAREPTVVYGRPGIWAAPCRATVPSHVGWKERWTVGFIGKLETGLKTQCPVLRCAPVNTRAVAGLRSTDATLRPVLFEVSKTRMIPQSAVNW